MTRWNSTYIEHEWRQNVERKKRSIYSYKIDEDAQQIMLLFDSNQCVHSRIHFENDLS